MTSSLTKSHKDYKRTESRNKHSWWWDSHISPKNSKWLAENVQEMDQSVKLMLKLIEDDGDSFAKKAEMYYQKRPQLISHVEDFYRMYRSLAEQYDNVTGELRKNIPSDLQSQGSGISDPGSEPPSTIPSSNPRARSAARAAGFDFFLKTGSDLGTKEGDETSTLDSESESDVSSVKNYSSASEKSDRKGLRKRIVELESEIKKNDNVEEDLRIENEKLKIELRLYESLASENVVIPATSELTHTVLPHIPEISELAHTVLPHIPATSELAHTVLPHIPATSELTHTVLPEEHQIVDHEDIKTFSITDGLESKFLNQEQKIRELEVDLKITSEKLNDSEEEVSRLRYELENNSSSNNNLQKKLVSSQKDVSKEKREVMKLQDRITRYKANLSERDREIRAMRETLSNANKTLSNENLQLQEHVTKILKESTLLNDTLKELDLRCQCSDEELRRTKTLKTELEGEIENIKIEKNDLVNKVNELDRELTLKDVKIDHLSHHLDQLHLEHVELVDGIEKSNKSIKKLKIEVERQREVIKEAEEEKREVIRQLCFSLEHYRDGYKMMRRAFVGHNKRFRVMAS